MMYKKSWIIPITVLLLCSVTLFFYQKNTDLNTYATPVSRTTLNLHKTPSDIVKLTIKWPTQTLSARRNGSSWVLTNPVNTLADGAYIYDIIQSFISPGYIELLEEHVENPNEYGINEHSTHITLYDSDGAEYELIQGNVANQDYYYAYGVQTGTLYGVPKKAFDMLSKDLSRWYDKNYIHFNPSTTKEVRVTFGDTTHSLTPIILHGMLRFQSSTLSEQEVAFLINFLSSSRALAYVVSNASPHIIESYGFNKDAIQFTILASDDTSKSFSISTSSFEDTADYVLLNDSNTIITIPTFSVQLKSSGDTVTE